MFIYSLSSVNNPNKGLQITLAGALAFHILILMIVWVEAPKPSLRPSQINVSLLQNAPETHAAEEIQKTSAQQLVDQLNAIQLKKTQQPRKRTISSFTHNVQDANYMIRWQSYVESVGNQCYPARALKENIRGSLRLLVAINKNGSVKEIKIRQSSGHPLLDEAAINTVKKAAPFEPLPPEISNEVDVLEIIRTWQFNGQVSTT